ncbi:MAG: type II toxin-antitoxin system RelB/DinJ family antitoxin [Synergistaceae bacterium]|nr:type II toxin-antitoxin system RelB/DinJ family antitoxin [Synergistaceae bacterium]MBQ4418480.1 type II toxin-antitoxin system RelB/DinJ family antitoxin [Synergistaceae bacterium]MBQ6908680.1 type II toxin-antitoxin system RelB/DinJ family antitoxin [Synergistaceae bacterium]MBQ9581964.1 type II toxin-antitoxin system RelB/DinJ family antitoxin [Synergistaceae bacterium]MBR0222045.1 type II toxin-antitoxin system RelB/DinJ family antitoxin [Synergistaceae bacterium]
MMSSGLVAVDPGLQEQAEIVLNRVGVSMRELVNMTLKQVIKEQDVPKELKASVGLPSLDNMTREEFEEFIEAGLRDIREGRVYSFEEVVEELNRDYGYNF